jgi:hypothetical protein
MKMQNQLVENSSGSEARAKRVRYVRENVLNISRAELCKNSVISEPSLKSWELALAGGLTEKGATKLEVRLHELGVYCPALWLLHGIGFGPTTNPEELNIFDTEEKQIADELLCFRKQPNAIDVLVRDDGMVPLLYPGNYAAGIVVKNIETAIGKDCIVKTGEDNLLIRKIHYGNEPDRYTLSCLNKDSNIARVEMKNVQIVFAAPVIWIRRKNPENK